MANQQKVLNPCLMVVSIQIIEMSVFLDLLKSVKLLQDAELKFKFCFVFLAVILFCF